jgi:hypothetical protein
MLQIYVSEDKIIVSGCKEDVEMFFEKLKEEFNLDVLYSGRCG